MFLSNTTRRTIHEAKQPEKDTLNIGYYTFSYKFCS